MCSFVPATELLEQKNTGESESRNNSRGSRLSLWWRLLLEVTAFSLPTVPATPTKL